MRIILYYEGQAFESVEVEGNADEALEKVFHGIANMEACKMKTDKGYRVFGPEILRKAMFEFVE